MYEKTKTREEIAPNIWVVRDFVPETELLAYFQNLKIWYRRTSHMYGRMISTPRDEIIYGRHGYSYASELGVFTMPDNVKALMLRVSKELGEPFNSCLMNRYRSGADSVDWHADDERELGADPRVASLSFGASRDFVLRLKRERTQKFKVTLHDGDLLYMGSGSQTKFEHCLPKRKGCKELRISATFRQVSAC